jgi:hypothetical protein
MLVSNNISLGLVQDIMTYNTDHTSDIVFPAKAITMIRFTDGFRFNALTSNHLMSTILGSNNKSADIVGFSNESENEDQDIDLTQKSISKGELFGTEFSLYPNPTNGLLTIGIGSDNSYNYSITSINGNLVDKSESLTGSAQIDLSKHPNGIYFVVIQTNNGELIRKKIVKL